MDAITKKVAIVIVNYNMVERVNELAGHIDHCVRWPHDLIVVDNGSDRVLPSIFSTVRLDQNIQTTNGWLAGLQYANALATVRNEKYLAYWLLITSAGFPPGAGDVLTPMTQWLVDHPDAVGIHPALTPESTTSWKHLITRGGDRPRETWMLDNIAALWRADWFDSIGRFDPNLIYGWGVDLETCWKARMTGLTLWVDERVRMEKITDIGYTMNRMGMDAQTRRELATENMRSVLSTRYGADWWDKMTKDGVYDDLR